MTRRDRHVRILESWGGIRSLTGSRTIATVVDDLVYRHGFALFTDEAIEMIVARVVSNWKRTRRMNRENRAIDAKARAS